MMLMADVRESIFTDRHRQFRAMLIAERKRARLTQPELAAKLGRPKSYVAKIEIGDRRLDVMEYLDLASALGFDPSRLIRKLRKSPTR